MHDLYVTEIYRPVATFLPLIVRAYLHSVLCVTVTQGHQHWHQSKARMRFPIMLFLTMCLSYFRDIMVYWSKICAFVPYYPPQSQLKPSQGVLPSD